MCFCKLIIRHKWKIVFIVMLTYITVSVSIQVRKDYVRDQLFSRGICSMVINEFIHNNSLQIEMMTRKLRIGGPGEYYISVKNNLSYNDKLIKKYTNGDYITVLPYLSVKEFNDMNPESCSTISSDNILKCNPYGDTYKEGDYICAYLKYKIRYLNKKGDIKIIDEYAYKDKDNVRHNHSNDAGYQPLDKDSAVILKSEKKYIKGVFIKKWKIIDWVDRATYDANIY